MTASEYQLKIYDWVKSGNGNAVIEAVAGSGKTTVLQGVTKIIPTNKRVLMIAFNKSIVEELQNKIRLENIKIQTSHSLGYGMIRNHFKYAEGYTPKLDVEDFKYRNYVKKNFAELTEGIEFEDKTDAEEFKQTVLSLVDMCRFYLCETLEDIENIADKYGYIVTSDHVRIIKNVINWGKELRNLETLDFGDMVSLPNYMNLSINMYKYDWVLVDEAQDLSVAQQELVKRCAKKNGTRFIFVGDSAQCIQTFAGSDNEAFNKLKSYPNTISLPLSLNYRCPAFVEKLAQAFVPEFQVFNKQRPGIFKENVLVRDIKDNSMVICRKTMPLIQLYLRLIKSNRKCYIKGLEIGANLVENIERLDMPLISNDFVFDGVIPRLYKELFEYRQTIMKKHKIDIYDATSEANFQRKLETINTIIALSDGIEQTYQLLDRCKKVFNQRNEGICLITNHKAKGLENDVVYHLCPSLLPDRRAIKDWEVQTEKNLEYVLYTRTKNEFYTISEEDFPAPIGSKDIKEMVSYLDGIEYLVNKIYNPEKEPQIRSNNTKQIEVPKKVIKKAVVKEEKKVDNSSLLPKFERLMTGKSIGDCYSIFNDFGISANIRVAFINGKPSGAVEDADGDTINVDINNEFDSIILRVVSIGK